MKISSKIFAVAGAALLLASCDFKPADFGNVEAKKYLEEEGAKVTFYSNTTNSFKVTDIAYEYDVNAKDATKLDVVVNVDFSADVDDTTIGGIKVYGVKEALCAYLKPTYTEITSKTQTIFIDDEDTKNPKKDTVAIKFTVAGDAYDGFAVEVPNTVKAAVTGLPLDQDEDYVWGETEDNYIEHFGSFTGITKNYEATISVNLGFCLPEITTEYADGKLKSTITVSRDIADNGYMKDAKWVPVQASAVISDWEKQLSEHVVLWVIDDYGVATKKTLAFSASRTKSSPGLTEPNQTTYKATVDVDVATTAKVKTEYVGIDTWVVNIGDVDIKWVNNNDECGSSKKAKTAPGVSADINPWRKLNTTPATITFEGEVTQLYQSLPSVSSLLTKGTRIKFVAENYLDADKDGKDIVTSLTIWYVDGLDAESKPVYKTLATISAEDDLFALKGGRSVVYTVTDDAALNTKLGAGLYITGGEVGDTVAITIYSKEQ